MSFVQIVFLVLLGAGYIFAQSAAAPTVIGAAATPSSLAATASGEVSLSAFDRLESEGQFYAARSVLRLAATSVHDPALLIRLAEVEDASGPSAARDYIRAAMAVRSADRSEYMRLLHRGIKVAARDGDHQAGAWFRSQLIANGDRPLLWRPIPQYSLQTGVWVPGGLEALAFIAHLQSKPTPEHFFADYARVIHATANANTPQLLKSYTGAFRDYFNIVAQLEALGARRGHDVNVVLSERDHSSQRRTAEILGLLGWKVRGKGNRLTIVPGESSTQSQHQDIASALAVDIFGVQDALQHGQDFTFDISDEWAPVVVDEQERRRLFYSGTLPGGFAEVLALDPRVAGVYAGFTKLGADARTAVLSGIGMPRLVEQFSDPFYEHSPALAVERGRAAVPGGIRAEGVWHRLTGADPGKAAAFFRALFEKDGQKLLALYSTLSQLDAEHQRFFTASMARTEGFYHLLCTTPQFASGAKRAEHNNSLLEFLRGVPLDGDGHVVFPGGPEAWISPKQRYEYSKERTLRNGSASFASAEQEDAILLRLATTRFSVGADKVCELDTFLALAHINAQRPKPLDLASTLLLAHSFGAAHAVYPYFTVLTGLERPEFEKFITLTRRVRALSETDQNVILGELHSLLELLCLAQQSGAIDTRQSAAIFARLCDRYLRSNTAADFGSASLDATRWLLLAAGTNDISVDDALRQTLLGRPAPARFVWNGSAHEIDSASIRSDEYQKVCKLQGVPRLAPLFTIYDEVTAIAADGRSASARINAIEAASTTFSDISLPKDTRATARVRENIDLFQPKKLQESIDRLKRIAAGRKPHPKQVQKCAREILAIINPGVKLALSGAVYAYYLRPTDLLVANDPLLLRKHQFRALDDMSNHELLPESELVVSSSGAGSYLQGGFASFSTAVGMIAAGNAKAESNSRPILIHQIGTLRSTAWSRLRDADLRLIGLKVRLGREWVVQAALQPRAQAALAATTLGLLSQTRRAELLTAISARDWDAAWKSVSLSDLYFLGDRYLQRREQLWYSPVTRALRQLTNAADATEINLLGASMPALLDCDQPRLHSLPPYEEYERHLLLDKLAERTCEFKLYLAVFADREGIPAAALGAIAEKLAQQQLAHASMADARDWPAVLAALEQITPSSVAAALGPS